jgi:WD40 repeat protein
MAKIKQEQDIFPETPPSEIHISEDGPPCPFTLLPTPVCVLIFSFLRPRDLYKIFLVSKKWSKFAHNDELWHRMFLKRFSPSSNMLISIQNGSNIGPLLSISAGDGFTNGNTNGTTNSKLNWKKEFRIATNWHTPNYREMVLRGHSHIVTGVKLLESKDRLFSTSLDGTVRVWQLSSGRPILTSRARFGGLYCLDINSSSFFTGGEDKTIVAWDMGTGREIRTFRHHKSGVLCLQVDDTKVVSGSEDGALRICDFRCKDSEPIAFQHKTSVLRCLQFDDVALVVGTEAGKIRMLDLRNGKCVHTYSEHSRYVSSVAFNQHEVVSASPDWSIKIWDRETEECVEVLEEHFKEVLCLRLDEQKIASGGRDWTIKVWDVNDHYWCVNTLRAHSGPVTCLDMNSRRLVTGSADTTVRVWDFSNPSYKSINSQNSGSGSGIGLGLGSGIGAGGSSLFGSSTNNNIQSGSSGSSGIQTSEENCVLQ